MRDDNQSDHQERPCPPGYEPPRVERALTPAELEREIPYAGGEQLPGVDD